MKIVSWACAVAIAFLLVLPAHFPAHGDDTKPLDSPIHMTYLPVPDALRNAPETPEMARAGQTTTRAANTQPAPNRDDSDADLSAGGRR